MNIACMFGNSERYYKFIYRSNVIFYANIVHIDSASESTYRAIFDYTFKVSVLDSEKPRQYTFHKRTKLNIIFR